MHNLRARKRPPPRGEVGAGLRGERPLVEQVELVHAPRLRQSVGAAQVGQLEELADDAPEQRSATAGVHFCRHVVLATRDHHLNAHGLIRHLRRAPCIPAINGRPVEREKFRVNVARGGAGFRCVVHAHDSTGEPPLPQLDVPSSSQVTLTSPMVCSSLSGVPPALGELGTPDTYGSSARRAASDIPRAHRMVVPATVYTWHTVAQVLRPASDMPHATDHEVGSSVSDMPHGSGRLGVRETPALRRRRNTEESRTFP